MKKIKKNELYQYYAQISQTIIGLIKQKQYQDALNLLNEELNQPYIPYDIFNALTNSKKDIEKMIIEQQYNKNFDSLTKLEIWNKIYNEQNNFIDISYISILLEKCEKEIDDFDISMINNIFANKAISNVDKWLLIELIIELKLDFNFKLYNNVFKKEFKFNLSTLLIAQDQLSLIANTLSKDLSKYPSELEIALQLLRALYTKFIPDEITYDNHDIINTIKNVVLSLFDHEELIENEITMLIKEFME